MSKQKQKRSASWRCLQRTVNRNQVNMMSATDWMSELGDGLHLNFDWLTTSSWKRPLVGPEASSRAATPARRRNWISVSWVTWCLLSDGSSCVLFHWRSFHGRSMKWAALGNRCCVFANRGNDGIWILLDSAVLVASSNCNLLPTIWSFPPPPPSPPLFPPPPPPSSFLALLV